MNVTFNFISFDNIYHFVFKLHVILKLQKVVPLAGAICILSSLFYFPEVFAVVILKLVCNRY